MGEEPGNIHDILLNVWGYKEFRPKQEEVIRSIVAGKDTLALLPTGGGKSLCFQVPGLAIGKLCLVVSPLIALMKDQVGRLRKQGVSARAIISTMSAVEIENALESAVLGKLSFLYVSPERLASPSFLARLPALPLGLIAVDEAHCVSQWGYDFRPSYLRIAEVRTVRPEIPLIALTASATSVVAQDIMAKLAFRTPHLIRGSFQRPELTLWVSKGEDKEGRLLKILKHTSGSAIVYVRTRRAAVRIAATLLRNGIAAAHYHAGLPAEERDKVQQEWTAGTLRCMVATNAFGMGIDKADVRAVMHMEPPPDLESYYQEAGRAGRDGERSYAFLLTGPGDVKRLKDRAMASYPELREVRKVYQAFADLHGIALGSGLFEAYSVDLQALSKRSGLPPTTCAASLKALELDGKLSLSDGFRSPSRVLITAPDRTVYQMRVGDARLGPLLEALLRLYGGLYEEPVTIDELRLARATEWQVESVVKRLKELHQQQVLHYRPRNDSPFATLLSPRIDAPFLVLDPAALALRKERAQLRMEAMINYMSDGGTCRTQNLLAYFGETEGPCGVCDLCLQMTKAAHVKYVDACRSVGMRGTAETALHRWDLDEGGPSIPEL